jgi:hypothetical protein
MISPTPWIERSFNFDFSAGLYPFLLERLRGTPARIEEWFMELMIVSYPKNRMLAGQ